jgi:hypothetical protein
VLILEHPSSDLKGNLVHDNDFTNLQDQTDYGLGQAIDLTLRRAKARQELVRVTVPGSHVLKV